MLLAAPPSLNSKRITFEGISRVAWWRTAESGHDARVYALTRAGRRTLQQEESDWRRYITVFSRVLEARPEGALT